jgi:hypothetical protein
VHHTTYRFGIFFPPACVTLCEDCHSLIHGFSLFDPLNDPFDDEQLSSTNPEKYPGK